MIIKTKRSYSSQRFKDLIEYIFDDKGRVNEANSFTIYHNLKSVSENDVIREFVENDQYRKKRHRGWCYTMKLFPSTLTTRPN